MVTKLYRDDDKKMAMNIYDMKYIKEWYNVKYIWNYICKVVKKLYKYDDN